MDKIGRLCKKDTNPANATSHIQSCATFRISINKARVPWTKCTPTHACIPETDQGYPGRSARTPLLALLPGYPWSESSGGWTLRPVTLGPNPQKAGRYVQGPLPPKSSGLDATSRDPCLQNRQGWTLRPGTLGPNSRRTQNQNPHNKSE